jgi:hypothetical protein
MNIACFLSEVSTGGGNHLTKDFARNIIKLNNKDFKITLITTTEIYDDFLNKNEIKYTKLNFSLFDRFLVKLWKKVFYRNMLNFFGVTSPMKNFVKKNKFDLIVFNSPSSYILMCKEIDFITCLWNTEIDDFKNFIEFDKLNYLNQKTIIETSVQNAFKLIVFTEKNKQDLVKRFNCFKNKIVTISVKPILPKIYEETKDKIIFKEEFEQLKLDKKKKWMLYPAQFWSHKNHEYIIKSVKEIDKYGLSNINFVFCGRDIGYLSEIKKKIGEQKLNDRFKIFGYLSDTQVIGLYLFSYALIIPTYVGRTTMPLLESFYFNKKVFYSNKILDDKYYNFISGIDLSNVKDFAEKLYLYTKSDKSNINNLKDIYHKECSDDLFVSRYTEIFNEFKFKKIIKK